MLFRIQHLKKCWTLMSRACGGSEPLDPECLGALGNHFHELSLFNARPRARAHGAEHCWHCIDTPYEGFKLHAKEIPTSKGK